MRAKKLIPLLALTTCFSCLGGCTQPDQKISFNNYWQYDSLTQENTHEILTYDVEYDKGSASPLFDYSLEYSDGRYITELATATENGKNVVVYKTELNITVVYSFNGKNSEPFHDKVVTETKFYTSENALRPISAFKEILSTSPAGGASSLATCYQTFHYETNTVYNEDCSGGTCTVTRDPDGENPTTKTNEFSFDEDKYSRLDNDQLLFALRCIPTTVSSAKAQIYSPFIQSEQTVSFSFAQDAGASFTYNDNGTDKTKDITYRPVSIVLDEQNPGATQTAWYAKMTDSTKNTHRNVMLRLETPLSYGFGSLVYKLKSVQYGE